MTLKQYFGDLNGGSLLLADARHVAALMLQMNSEEDWQYALKDQNILQRKSIPTALRTAATIRKRLSYFDKSYIEAVAHADSPDYQQLLMATLVKDSPIVADFLDLYVRETARIYKPAITKDMWWEHVDVLRRRAEGDLPYSDSTIEKMGKNLFRALAESGYIDSVRNKQLQHVYISPMVKCLIEQNGHSELVEKIEWTL
ncbi:DUF1819 family protein [Marinomonas algarum]|uniref:DUF1819 family protein n=1 Tax=Marinomonas algarum TaxID=2883105 RepID=A0A9X1ILP4_9GAMM|nr:DUF1819 family protein [Marinomonas algarum]MCB5160351.1 DUF1819 family protein [Marinomonas algarum]